MVIRGDKMPIIYRDATKEDIIAINNLFIELVKTVNKRMEKENIEPYKKLENGLNNNAWNEFFKNDDKKIIVAEDNNKVIGFLSVINHKDYVYLDDYCVNNDYRGKGIGSKLMSMADEYARKKNINKINTHVESANHESIDFYMNKGFKIQEKQGHRLLITKEVPLMKTKEELFDRNNKIINEVLDKIERTCPNSVDMVAIGGSFASGDYHEKSDLDIVVIRNNDDAIKIHKCFIMDGIGYDIYSYSWEDFKKMTRYETPYVTKLKQLDIIYTRNNEVIEKYKSYQADLNDNMNNELLIRNNVSKLFSKIIKDYGDLLSGNTSKKIYKSLGSFVENTENIVYLINRKYLEHGVKMIPIEIIKMKDLPKNFIKEYQRLFDCNYETEIIDNVSKIYSSLEQYIIDHGIEIKMRTEFNKREKEKPEISSPDLDGSFEELYSNYYNKLKCAYENNDKFLSFRSLVDAQNFYDYFFDKYNVSEIDIISKYNPNDLKQNFDVFVNSLKIWKSLYDKNNKKIDIVENPKEIYDNKRVFTVFPSKAEKEFSDELNKEGDDSISVTTSIDFIPDVEEKMKNDLIINNKGLN